MAQPVPSEIKYACPAAIGCFLPGISSNNPMLAIISASTRLSTYTQSVLMFASPTLKDNNPIFASESILGRCLSSPGP